MAESLTKQDIKESVIEALEPLAVAMQADFNKVNERFDRVDADILFLKENKADKSDIDNLLNAVDSYAKKADTYFQEMVMLAHRVDRHEKWLHQVAEKLGIKLDY